MVLNLQLVKIEYVVATKTLDFLFYRSLGNGTQTKSGTYTSSIFCSTDLPWKVFPCIIVGSPKFWFGISGQILVVFCQNYNRSTSVWLLEWGVKGGLQ